MGDAIAGIKDNTGGTARGIQGQYSLNGHVHGGHVEGLEHDLQGASAQHFQHKIRWLLHACSEAQLMHVE